MSDLSDALERSREMITEALESAHAELAALKSRQAELEDQIAEAESALGSGVVRLKDRHQRLTLHEALAKVLRESGTEWMTARELTDEVNRRGLYRKRDGSALEVNQVHARTNNYDELFEKEGSNIRLREESPALITIAQGITIFRDDDAGFFDWLDANQGGYFVNTERNPKANYLVLHAAACSHFDRSPSMHWTKDYVKVCSTDREELEDWAADAVGGEVTLCRSCFG
jgi:hypothetical protein